MTDQDKARELQLAFREQLRKLCLAQYELTQKAGGDLPAIQAASMIAEECLHMSAWFVTRGSNYSVDTFLDECRKLYEWHKDVARKELGRPN